MHNSLEFLTMTRARESEWESVLVCGGEGVSISPTSSEYKFCPMTNQLYIENGSKLVVSRTATTEHKYFLVIFRDYFNDFPLF